MPKVKCNICKEVLADFTEGAAHMATHEPRPAPKGRGEAVFKVGWKRDGTIRQPKGAK